MSLEIFESRCGRSVFARSEFAVRCVRHAGGLMCTDLPVAEPVMHAGEAVGIVQLGREHRRDSQRQQVRSALVGQAS